MKRFLYSAAAFAALVAAGPGVQAQSAESTALAKRLVVASGLAVQLEAFPKQVDQEMAQARGRMPDEVLDALAGAARESFSPALLRVDIERTLAASLAAEEMKKAIAWLETGAGLRVTRAEELASDGMTHEAVQAHVESTQRRPPSERRNRLIADLVTSTTAVEGTAKLMESIALGIALGMDAMQPAQKRLGLAALQARVRSALPPEQLRKSIAEVMPGLYGFTYRELSDADLADYVAFNRSAHGKRYNDAMMAALTDALTRASVRVGALMDARLQNKAA